MASTKCNMFVAARSGCNTVSVVLIPRSVHLGLPLQLIKMDSVSVVQFHRLACSRSCITTAENVTCCTDSSCRVIQDFPYNYEEGIEHHVLWSSHPLTAERIQQVNSSHLCNYGCLKILRSYTFVAPFSVAPVRNVEHVGT
jgi:hypothetical protein